MNIEAFNWSTVIAGYWNRAILTPAGIRQRLFDLPENTPLEVEVPLDGIAPYRVRHEQLIVMVEDTRLIITSEYSGYENLEKANALAVTALKKLPETPVKAAGFNILYKIADPSEDLVKG